jgi:ADP-heptose:LPS heptosyltransferase
MARPVVLVFRIGQLGDSLVSLPAIRAIRAAHPDAGLVLLTDRQRGVTAVPSWEVYEPTGLFDAVAYLDVPSRLTDYVAAARAVRAWAPSRLYYLTPMPRSPRQVARDRLFFRWLCGIRDSVGLRPTPPYPVRDAAGTLVRLEHEGERLLEWIAPALPDRRGRGSDERLRLAPPLREHAARLLEDAGFEGHPIVAFGPGSKMAAKKWPEDRFAAVGHDLLRQRPDARLIVLGGAEERPIGDRLCVGWGSRAVNLMGVVGIWDAAAVLERCALYIGNDTGTMHLAATVGVPCVAIFSARDNPGRWEPSGAGHVVLRHDVPCAGCMLTDCLEQDLACLRGIAVHDVSRAALARLESLTPCSTTLSRASAG